MDLLDIMKALKDENRLRILNLLNKRELCVCELQKLLGICQPNASRNLNKLVAANLIEFEKKGLYVYYKINEKLLVEYPFLRTFLSLDICKYDMCTTDLRRLNELKN